MSIHRSIAVAILSAFVVASAVPTATFAAPVFQGKPKQKKGEIKVDCTDCKVKIKVKNNNN